MLRFSECGSSDRGDTTFGGGPDRDPLRRHVVSRTNQQARCAPRLAPDPREVVDAIPATLHPGSLGLFPPYTFKEETPM